MQVEIEGKGSVNVSDKLAAEVQSAVKSTEGSSTKWKELWPKVEDAFGDAAFTRGTPEYKAVHRFVASMHPAWREAPERGDNSDAANSARAGRAQALTVASVAMSLMIKYRSQHYNEGAERGPRRKIAYAEKRQAIMKTVRKYAAKGDEQAIADLNALLSAKKETQVERLDVAIAAPRTVGEEAKKPGPVTITKPAPVKARTRRKKGEEAEAATA
jgi:hypothetical protein